MRNGYDQIPDHYKDVGRGWSGILAELHYNLSTIYPSYEVLQVKEKFGGLRVYINHLNIDEPEVKRMEDFIRQAEGLCWVTCENCGAATDKGARPPKGRRFGWVKVYCDMCRDGATGVSTYE